ncbi:hypothetical protein DB347_25160 [Opitutaceae bacterium EW11]|nr:hypothetical protein DB347_25160 [Opitutaceae bacterium EW11]
MKPFRYIAVEWRHEHPNEPILLLAEVDAAGWEQRKVEVFRNGARGYANSNAHSLNTRLGEAPVPTVAEIAENPEFVPRIISREEFERAWEEARSENAF